MLFSPTRVGVVTGRRCLKSAPHLLALALLAASAAPSLRAQLPDLDPMPSLYEVPGRNPNRSYVDQHLVERIDPFSGKLQLGYVDLFLPGNGGLDLAVRRSYSSVQADRGPGEPSPWGVGWTMSFGRVLRNTTTALCHFGLSQRLAPVLELPGGNRETLHDAPNAGIYFITPSRYKGVCASGGLGMHVFAPDGTRYDFTHQGLPVGSPVRSQTPWLPERIEDRNGNWLQFTYQRFALFDVVSTITASDGRSLEFTYSGGALESIVTNDGRTVTYDLRPLPGWFAGSYYLLDSMVCPDGLSWSYTYDETLSNQASDYNLSSMRYPTGGTLDYSYDFVNFYYNRVEPRTSVVAQKTSSDGGIWTFAYRPGTRGWQPGDEQGDPDSLDRTTIVGPKGTEIYWHSGYAAASTEPLSEYGIGLVLRKKIGTLQEEGFVWAPQLISNQLWVHQNGFTTFGAYAPLLEVHGLVRDGALYEVTNSAFDDYGNPQTIVEQSGTYRRQTTIGYQIDTAKWLLRQRATEEVDTIPGRIQRQFDANGNVSWEDRYGVRTTFSYHSTGDLHTRTDARTQTVTFEDYVRGVPERELYPEAVTITRSVSGAGNVEVETDGEGRTTRFFYDGLNRLIRAEHPLGAPVTVAWAANTRTLTRGAYREVATFDGFGRTTGVAVTDTVRAETILQRTTYNAGGQKTFQSYPGSTTEGVGLVVVQLVRLRLVTFDPSTRRRHDYFGLDTLVTDENGLERLFRHRAYGNPDQRDMMQIFTQDQNADVEITRNGLGQVTAISQGLVSRSFEYDGRYFLVSQAEPETGTTLFGRDAVGNMVSRQVAGNPAATFGYDGLARLRTDTYPAGTPPVVREYWRDGKAKSIDNGLARREYSYDRNRNLERETLLVDGLTLDVRYEYDPNDALSAMVYGTGTRIEYAPDGFGRPTRAVPFVTSIEHHPSGGPRRWVFANGVVNETTLNPRRWPATLRAVGGSTILDQTYGYDPAGYLLSVTDAADSLANRTLGYDLLDRLAVVNGPWGGGTIGYDGRGNILQQTFGASQIVYTYQPGSERLVSVAGARSYNLTYDSYGNVTSRDGVALAWDHASRLACARCGQADEVRYLYDGAGARVQARTASATTYFFHGQGGDLLYEQSPGIQQKEYVHVLGRLVAERLVGAAAQPLLHTDPVAERAAASVPGVTVPSETVAAGETSGAGGEPVSARRNLRSLRPPPGNEAAGGGGVPGNQAPRTGVAQPAAPPTGVPQARRRLATPPAEELGFEWNAGQWPGEVLYRARGRGEELRIEATGAAWMRARAAGDAKETGELRLRLVGAARPRSIGGEGELAARGHYFFGERPSDWRTNVPRFARVRLREVYPGVDQVFYRRDDRFEYDLVVAAGADPAVINLAFDHRDGAVAPVLSPEGDLSIPTAAGALRQARPLVYQQVAGVVRRVDAHYAMRPDGSANVVLGEYDPATPLVIDPSFGFSTYLGTWYEDYALGVASDPAGNVLVAGVRVDFSPNAIVTKLSPTGALLWEAVVSGYQSQALAVATDQAGNVYVAGLAQGGWPTTGAFQPQPAGGWDATVVKLSPDGATVLYGSYLGGTGSDQATAIAVDSAGRVYLAGTTRSTDFPVRNAFQAQCDGDCTRYDDGFLARIAAGGGVVDYATYIGGDYDDRPTAVAVTDAVAGVWLTGTTSSPDFPLANAYQVWCAGGCGAEAFVMRFAGDGQSLVYSTFFGTYDPDGAHALAVDAQGAATIGGFTHVSLAAVSLGGPRPPAKASFTRDGLIARFTSAGALAYVARFTAAGAIHGVALSPGGRTHVVGREAWREFGWVNPLQPFLSDLFVATVDPTGTFLEFASGIAVNFFPYGANGGIGGLVRTPAGALVVAGSTVSNLLPAMFAAQPEPGSQQLGVSLSRPDMFVIQLDPGPVRLELTVTPEVRDDDEPLLLTADLPGATGEAVFWDGRTEIGRAPFGGGRAQLEIQLEAGDRYIYATFAGDGTEPRAVSEIVHVAVRTFAAIDLDADRETINAGALVRLYATVYGVGGPPATGTLVFKERLPQGDAVVGTLDLPQYQLALSPPPGLHTYYFEYSGDALYFPGTSIDVTVRVRARPKVSIDAPLPGARFSPQDAIAVKVSATTEDAVRIRYVDLMVDGQLRGRRTAAPFRFRLEIPALGLGIGQHVLWARATDTKGGMGDSPTVTIEVASDLPQVTWVRPPAGATVPAPVGLLLEVTAVSPLGRPLTSVQFFANGQPVGTRTTPPWALVVFLTPGAYTLGASATDNQGLAGNAPPRAVTITDPGAGAVITYIHGDPAGSPIAATNASGQLLWRESYRPFGERLRRMPGSTTERHFFHGKPEDGTGLQYFGARYYDPVLGRFLSVDPAPLDDKDIHSLNRYAYGNNNPFVFRDADGRWPSFILKVHQNSIDRALGFLPESDRQILRDVQQHADRCQKVEDSPRPAQDSPHFANNDGNARNAANDLVRGWIMAARAEGDYQQALFYVGLVIHALQDATSPSHAGFTHWDGHWGLETIGHLLREFFDPGAGSRLDAATRLAWEYFTGQRALPEDFFEGLGVDQPPVAQGGEVSPP